MRAAYLWYGQFFLEVESVQIVRQLYPGNNLLLDARHEGGDVSLRGFSGLDFFVLHSKQVWINRRLKKGAYSNEFSGDIFFYTFLPEHPPFSA